MIQKQKLTDFMQRYYLAGNVDAIKLSVDNDELSTTFISDDSNVIGTVKGTGFTGFEDGEIAIYTTGQLLKMMSVLDDEIEIEYLADGMKPAYAIKISDKYTSASYMLADLGVIRAVPKSKSLPNWDVTIPITKEFIQKYLKAKSGMPEAENFAVVSDGTSTSIILNYATINTNRIMFPVTPTLANSIQPTCFSANIFKEVLAVNKDAESALIEVSQAGLAKVTFKGKDFEAVYFLLKLNIQ